jgi:hypothetical protein
MKTPARLSRATLACVAISLAYALLGLVILIPDAVYSGDIGVKFVQARALATNRFSSLGLPYPGGFLDPSFEFFPMRSPFILDVGGTPQAIFSPAAAVMQSGLVALAGIRGLIVGSVLSGLVILLAATRLAVPSQRLAVAIALGIGSPLWFYAVTGWEHAPAVALSTAAFALAFAGPRSVSYMAAGVLAGCGATLRDEAVLLIPGLLILIALKSRSVRHTALAVLGAALPLALSVYVDVAWFGRPAAAHLRHAVHILENAADIPTAAPGSLPTLTPFTLAERYQTVIQYWLLGYGADPWIIGFVASLAGALLVRRTRWRWRSIPLLVWLLGIAVLGLADAWEVITAPKWLAGLHRVAPYLVFAVLPAPAPQGDRLLHRTIVLTTAIYVLAAFAGVDTTGGKSLGPRLLLPLLPLLAVISVARIHAYRAAPDSTDRWIGALGFVLVAIAVLLHAGGTVPAYYGRNRIDASSILAAEQASPRVIVADDPFTAQLLFPMYYRKIIFLADTASGGEKLGARLAEARVTEALIVSRRPQPATELRPLNLLSVSRVGRMVIQHWGR